MFRTVLNNKKSKNKGKYHFIEGEYTIIFDERL